jgi:competence protein ComEA
MSTDNLNRFWLIATGFLILIILANGLFFAFRYNPGQKLEISANASPQYQGSILIEGAVAQPGFYPLKSADNLSSLLSASGGAMADADLDSLRLYIPYQTEKPSTQKININLAELWLLEALPGIGETKAQAILQYRQQFGPFQNIQEITEVPGISNAIFQNIKELITVSN